MLVGNLPTMVSILMIFFKFMTSLIYMFWGMLLSLYFSQILCLFFCVLLLNSKRIYHFFLLKKFVRDRNLLLFVWLLSLSGFYTGKLMCIVFCFTFTYLFDNWDAGKLTHTSTNPETLKLTIVQGFYSCWRWESNLFHCHIYGLFCNSCSHLILLMTNDDSRMVYAQTGKKT